jgi:hypothetical protein
MRLKFFLKFLRWVQSWRFKSVSTPAEPKPKMRRTGTPVVAEPVVWTDCRGNTVTCWPPAPPNAIDVEGPPSGSPPIGPG